MNHSRTFRFSALLLVLALMLSACGAVQPSTSAEPETTPPVTTEAPTAQEPTTEAPTTEAPATEARTTEEPVTEAPHEPVTIDEYTLIEEEDLQVVIQNFDENEEGARIGVYAWNGTELNIALCCTSLTLNGYTMTEPAAICLEMGTELYGELFFDRASLEELGIKEIGSVIVDYKVIDTDTGEAIADPDAYEIKTSAFERMADDKVWDGRELYHDNDVRILLTDVTGTGTGGFCFKLLIENSSKNNLALVGVNAIVNGRIADAPYLAPVDAGRKALTSLIVTKTAMDQSGIVGEIDSLELSLEARDSGNWDLLFRTGELFCDLSGNVPSFSNDTEADAEFVAEKTILDTDEITADVLGWVAPEEHNPGLKLRVQNKTDKPVRFRVGMVVADDYLLNNCGMVLPIAAGETAEAVLWLDQYILNMTGNEEVGTVELYCSLQDGESHETLKTFNTVTVETAAKDRVKIVSSMKGRSIYNEKKLQITVIAYTGYSETIGERLYLWVKNSSDKTMVLEPIYTMINGSYMLGIGKLTVPAGKMTIGAYTVPARETVRLGVREFRSMIMNTQVYDTAGKLQFTTTYGGIELK